MPVDPHWQEDQDEFGVYADVLVPETQVSFRMRRIDPGIFLMGSPADDNEAFDDEMPRHEVTITKGFWLEDTPCTQAVYEALTGENPFAFKGASRPVENVSWDDVQDFLQELNERLPSDPFMLPTEAQWEFACRAGTLAPRYGPLNEVAWYDDNSDRTTHPVRRKQPNAWGLYDMLGNVDEWCLDKGLEKLALARYTHAARVDPIAKSNKSQSARVIRGGSWFRDAQYARAAFRDVINREVRRGDVGFRLARGRAA